MPLSVVYQSELIKSVADVSIGDIPADLEVEIPLRLTLLSGKEGERLSIQGEVRYATPTGTPMATTLNQVTVRFVGQKSYQQNLGLVKPVAKRVAEQMNAAQVLKYSRAFNRGDPKEQALVERELDRVREYLARLDDEDSRAMLNKIDFQLHAIRDHTSLSKQIHYDSYAAQRFMRKPGKKK